MLQQNPHFGGTGNELIADTAVHGDETQENKQGSFFHLVFLETSVIDSIVWADDYSGDDYSGQTFQRGDYLSGAMNTVQLVSGSAIAYKP